MRILILGILILLISCNTKSTANSPTIQFDTKSLYGSWTIMDALRNNRPTQTINGAVLTIDSIQLSHNIFGVLNSFLYSRSDSSLITNDQINYKVEFVNDSILIMNALIQNYNFKFSLKKNIDSHPILTESDSIPH